MKILIDIEGISPAEEARREEAALAVFAVADVDPWVAAQAAFDREISSECWAMEPPPLTQEKVEHAATWDAAVSAALEGAPEGADLQILRANSWPSLPVTSTPKAADVVDGVELPLGLIQRGQCESQSDFESRARAALAVFAAARVDPDEACYAAWDRYDINRWPDERPPVFTELQRANALLWDKAASVALEGAPPESNMRLVPASASGDELLKPSQLALIRSIRQPDMFPLPADIERRVIPLMELGLVERDAGGRYVVPQAALERLSRAGHLL